MGVCDSKTNIEECPICLEILNTREWSRLHCTHAFHVACMGEWSKRCDSQRDIDDTSNVNCPICRRTIEDGYDPMAIMVNLLRITFCIS